jgi:hypothetical protein
VFEKRVQYLAQVVFSRVVHRLAVARIGAALEKKPGDPRMAGLAARAIEHRELGFRVARVRIGASVEQEAGALEQAVVSAVEHAVHPREADVLQRHPGVWPNPVVNAAWVGGHPVANAIHLPGHQRAHCIVTGQVPVQPHEPPHGIRAA